MVDVVSTRSRPKAAGQAIKKHLTVKYSFNTQPPEGGWFLFGFQGQADFCFNTQPPEGGWFCDKLDEAFCVVFQHAAARRRLEPLSKALLHQVSQP